MAIMQRIALLLAVCGALAVSTGAQAPKEAATSAAFPSMAEYDTADYTHVCLRAATIKDCSIVGCFAGLYFQQGMQCCHGDKPYRNSMSESLMGEDTIGHCDWTFNPFMEEMCQVMWCLNNMNGGRRIIIGTGPPCEAMKLGTYSVQCSFKKGAEECDDGVCDDMILQSTGDMHWVPEVFLKSTPILSGDYGLKSKGLAYKMIADNAGKVGSGAWDALLQNISDAYQHLLPKGASGLNRKTAKLEGTNYGGEHEFTLGSAIVTSGPVSVFSKHTNLKYKEGFLHAVPHYDTWGVEGQPGLNSVIVDPYRYDLKLKRGGGY